MSEVTQADALPTADEIEQVALLFEAMRNKPAAWAVRKAGLCGTVHHAALDFLRARRLVAYAAGKADERERCARIADKESEGFETTQLKYFRELCANTLAVVASRETAERIAAAIRSGT